MPPKSQELSTNASANNAAIVRGARQRLITWVKYIDGQNSGERDE